MKNKQIPPELTVEVAGRDWDYTLQGEPVLHCVLSWPEMRGTWKGVAPISRYYRRVVEEWEKRWQRELYLRACLDFADRQATGKPFRVWTARLTTCVTRQEGGVLSLWQEGEEQRGFDVDAVLVSLSQSLVMLILGGNPIASGSSGGNGYTSFLLLCHPVHRCTTVVGLAHTVSFTGIKKDSLGSGSLTSVDMRHYTNVSGILKRKFSWH